MSSAMIGISLTLDNTSHNDLTLSIPALNLKSVADTYYFLIALQNQSKSVSTRMIKNAVASLLRYWIASVENCADGQVVHLPFDFSDQYIGCIEVKKEDAVCVISYGYTLTEGWAVDPLDMQAFSNQVQDFRVTTDETFELDVASFLAQIELSLQFVTLPASRP